MKGAYVKRIASLFVLLVAIVGLAAAQAKSVGAYTTLEILLNAFCGAALEQHGGRTPSFKNRRILDLLGNNAPDPHWPLYTSFLRMIDFIAGMTDSYATEMAREMTGRSSPV